MLILIVTCVLLAAVSRSVALAADDSPVTADSSVYAVVPEATPDTRPVITNVTQGAVYTNSDPLNVSGTCPRGSLLKIFKNEVLAGSVFCDNGRFSINIDLFLGSNTLIVRAYNRLNTSGPESLPVVVSKNISGINLSEVGKQLFITSEVFYAGVKVNETLKWPLTVGGGYAPYAISVAWGDGKTDLISRGTEGTFDIQHNYEKPGKGESSSYDVTIMATDSVGNKSFIHLVSIVAGDEPGVATTIKKGYDLSGALRAAWQITLLLILVVVSFWLGEKRELRLLRSNKVKLA